MCFGTTAFDDIKCLVKKKKTTEQLTISKAPWESLRASMVACLLQTGVDGDDTIEADSLISKFFIMITLAKTVLSGFL